jgi:hypothetical protein
MIELTGIWSLSPLGGMLGMIVLFYWLLATGRIITRSSHERELRVSDKRGDEWKETAIEYRVVTSALTEQNGKLIESNRISDHFYREVFPSHMPSVVSSTPEGTV